MATENLLLLGWDGELNADFEEVVAENVKYDQRDNRRLAMVARSLNLGDTHDNVNGRATSGLRDGFDRKWQTGGSVGTTSSVHGEVTLRTKLDMETGREEESIK